jgi:Holliday junction resolvase RusA-like endonuclease
MEGPARKIEAMIFEFLIPRRPVSLQTRNRRNLQAWKAYVRSQAVGPWASRSAITGSDLQLTLVYLYDSDPVDIDNIIKPIQDALVGLVYDDDLLVSDVDSHRRSLGGTFELTRLPSVLFDAIVRQEECVYVRVRDAIQIEDCL